MKNVLFTFLLIYSATYAQDVINYNGNEQTLAARWTWAVEKAGQTGLKNYWIVYTFQRLMPENSIIGPYYNGDKKGKKLEQILYPGRPVDYIESLKGEASMRSSKKVNKEVALLFDMSGDQISDTDISTIDLYFKLQGKPLIWLGQFKEKESMNYISHIYKTAKSEDARETLITAAGMHSTVSESFTFLKDIIENDSNNDLRENAVFWIGQTENLQVIPYLKEIALSDRDDDVAEKAVFSIYNSDKNGALDAVIFLAQQARGEIRKKAVFWIGQMAGKKALESLGDIVFSEEETDIQKQAVFALSQLDDNQGIPKLIKIAKTHPNPKIRKNAIFWLGESSDDRALDALIDMAKK